MKKEGKCGELQVIEKQEKEGGGGEGAEEGAGVKEGKKQEVVGG